MTFARNRHNELVIDEVGQETAQAKIIEDKEGRHLIEDMHSDGGTFLNGYRVTKAKLLHGDELQLGPVQCTYIRTEMEVNGKHQLDGVGVIHKKHEFDVEHALTQSFQRKALLAQETAIKDVRHQLLALQNDFGQMLSLLVDIKKNMAGDVLLNPGERRQSSPKLQAVNTLGGDDSMRQVHDDLQELLEKSKAELEEIRQEQEHANQTLNEKYQVINKLREEKKELENVSYSLAQARARLSDYETTASILTEAYKAKRQEIHQLSTAAQVASQQLSEMENRKGDVITYYQQLVQQYHSLYTTVEQLKAEQEQYQNQQPVLKAKFPFSKFHKAAS